MKPALYALPQYYDLAFSRDLTGETDFYIKCFNTYSKIDVKNILEPACGSGMFMYAFGERGYNVTGYDLNPEMVEYTRQEINKRGLNSRVKVFVGDMKDTKYSNEFDAAINPINSIGYCVKDSDIISHFKCTGATIKKGGVYIVEVSTACKDVKNEKKADETWYAERDGIKLEATWNPYEYDLNNKIRRVRFRMNVNDNGKQLTFEEEHTLRLWFYNDLKIFAQHGGFHIEAIYNQTYDKIPLDSEITGEMGVLYYVMINK